MCFSLLCMEQLKKSRERAEKKKNKKAAGVSQPDGSMHNVRKLCFVFLFEQVHVLLAPFQH